jgi:hypothetical protein
LEVVEVGIHLLEVVDFLEHSTKRLKLKQAIKRHGES